MRSTRLPRSRYERSYEVAANRFLIGFDSCQNRNMKLRHRFLFLLFALFLAALTGCQGGGDDAEKSKADAANAAAQWLAMIDQGKYADAWNGAADAIKKMGNQQQFAAVMRARREPMGKAHQPRARSVPVRKESSEFSARRICRAQVQDLVSKRAVRRRTFTISQNLRWLVESRRIFP